MKYLMYLRKSRADDPGESVEQTLSRHKARLDEYCRNNGIAVDASDILSEVSSADSIASRPQMMELLHRVESGDYAAVICIDMDRLSRGSGADQALVINTFKYSHTKIITPLKTYDFENDLDEQFAELGLFLGRSEYRMIKKRLMQGRIASAKEGKFCTGNAPYGYETYKLTGQKGFSLRIIPEEAAVIRNMFQWYIFEGMGYKAIAARLNAAGISSKYGVWSASHVYKILSDPTYCGKIRFRYKVHEKQMKEGCIVHTEHRNPVPIIAQGLHEAIISEETFAQVAEAKRSRRTPHIKVGFKMANPFCSLVKCAYCGKNLALNTDKKGVARLRCNTPGCANNAVLLSVLEDRVLFALSEWLKDYEIVEPIKSMASELEEKRAMLAALGVQVDSERKRESRIMDLLEQGTYTLTDYQKRIKECRDTLKGIEEKIAKAQEEVARLEEYEAARARLAPSVRTIIDRYNTMPTAKEKNLMLKEILEKAEFRKDTKGRGSEDDFEIVVFPRLPS